MNEPKRIALVKYLGRRSAPFEVTLVTQTRRWTSVAKPRATRRVINPARQSRWLPAEEAELYHRLPQFTIVRRGTALEPDSGNNEPVGAPPPPVEAVPLDAFLAAAAATRKAIEEAKKTEPPPFIMARSGIVHRASCSNAPKVVLESFWNLADARNHSRYKKVHRCVEV